MSLLVAPILIPMIAAATSMLLWRRLRVQRAISVVSCAAMLVVALMIFSRCLHGEVLVLEAGNWDAPFGIVLVADLLSAVMVLMTALTGLATAIYALPTLDLRFERAGYFPLMHMVLAGVAGAFLTGDIFNLYVWFEVMLMASFALLAMGGERAQMAGALQYVVLNLVSSALFLTATGLLYGLAGTLNMADLAQVLPTITRPERVTTIATLFLIAFGIKAAAFPLYFWLPASYHTPPVAVSALFAGLLTKVGVYALYRVFTLVFTHEMGMIRQLLEITAGATMLVGALGALAQNELRRALAFQHIGQVGYLLLGLALFTADSFAGGVFYIVHHIAAMANLFLLSGALTRLGGTQDMDRLGGFWAARPVLSLLFLIPALSLGGVPPLSGFWAKLLLVQAAVSEQAWWLLGIALVAGLLTLFAVARIWANVFWKPAPTPLPATPVPAAVWAVTASLAALTVAIGIGGQWLLGIADEAGLQLASGSAYINAVLGGAP